MVQVEAEANAADMEVADDDTADAPSLTAVAQQAEHKQQAFESNKRLKASLQAVSSDQGQFQLDCLLQLLLVGTQLLSYQT